MNRRALFGIIGGGAAVVAASGFFGVRALIGKGGDASGQADNWDANTLPTAAGRIGGITTADINSVVQGLNTALSKRDRAAFVAHYAAGAAATQAGRMFDNLGKFTFDKLEYQVIGQGGRLFNSGNGSAVNMNIALVHQVKGVDATPLPEWYQWTVSRAGTSTPVVITGMTGAPSVWGEAKYVYYPAIWDSPNDIVVIERPNVVMAAETAEEGAILTRSADTIARAIVNNRTVWKQAGGLTKGLAPGAFIVGTSDRNKFYSWYSGEANQYGHEAALTIPVIDAASMDTQNAITNPVCGSRIVADLTSDYFSRDTGEDTPQTLIQHEDTHNMTFSIMTADESSIPLWVIEGFADFMATRTYPNPVQSYFQRLALKRYATVGDEGLKWDGTSLPTDAQVYAADVLQSAGSYALGALAYYFIEQKYGLDKAVAFVSANYRPPASASGQPGGDKPTNVVSQVLGITLDEFQTQWAAFVHQAIGA